MALASSIITSMAFLREKSEEVFADSFHWIALSDFTNAAHKRACEVEGLVVTGYEIIEDTRSVAASQPLAWHLFRPASCDSMYLAPSQTSVIR